MKVPQASSTGYYSARPQSTAFPYRGQGQRSQVVQNLFPDYPAEKPKGGKLKMFLLGSAAIGTVGVLYFLKPEWFRGIKEKSADFLADPQASLKSLGDSAPQVVKDLLAKFAPAA